MDKKEAAKRIDRLKKTINYHRYLYHALDRQEISDEALDSLKKELFDLESQYPDLVTEDSPTQRIGAAPLKEFQKVIHTERMLSLQDVFSQDDFYDWHKRTIKLLTPKEQGRVDFYCELKIDGLAIELEYQDGRFKKGSTRGDGLAGEDITHNLKTIEAIPLILESGRDKVKIPKNLVVRGEVFISKKEFKAINEMQKKNGLPLYANPRNIAAGSVRQLDPKITAQRNLDSFAYDITGDVPVATHEEKHAMLSKLGFKVNRYNVFCASIDEVFNFYQKAGKMRESLDYEIDGVVVIINNNSLFKKLGVVGKAPRGAVAFKFAQSQAATIVKGINIQIGRTGAITPIAILRPVKVSGVTISRATLHNEDEIRRLGLKTGDTVVVGRAGDVIPDIVKVLDGLRTGEEKEFIMPSICPSCHAKLEKTVTESLLRCPNPKCFARQRRNFYHFVSRAAFNIEGLGPKIINRLLDEGLVQDVSDLFSLKEGDIKQLERFGEKSAENLIQSIESKKEISLQKLIYALGIRNVGEETAVNIADKFGSLDKISTASLADFESVVDIGPVVAKSLQEWFFNKDNKKLLGKLLAAGIIIKNPKKNRGGKLSGKVFILTGHLGSMEREEAKEKIRNLGGDVSELVSKKISYVVAGSSPGSKLKKAQKIGIKIVNEKEFLSIIT